ncbi:hypothetical protein [Mogibacterium diversum]|uniref:hypothetical protein n=1 Tax=Mogibacterium diversum TaxID=114527 RepID=UPI0028D8D30A|nr:hypothetical protein [Mogibacterium diversum]
MCELELEDQLRLLKDGLTELATEIGDTQINPKSLSLLCLDFEVPVDIRDSWILEFRKLSDIEYKKYSSKEIITIFRNIMQERFDPAKEFSDLIVFSFIRVISKNLVEELYPLSCYLLDDFSFAANLN